MENERSTPEDTQNSHEVDFLSPQDVQQNQHLGTIPTAMRCNISHMTMLPVLTRNVNV